MNPRIAPLFCALALIVTVLLNQPSSFACGPFSLDAIFVFTRHPEYPLEKFAGGDLGVLQSTYARSYLFVAYRNLDGSGLNKEEQEALTSLWKDRLELAGESEEPDWTKDWLEARAKVPGVAALGGITVYRNREKPNEWETYLNCQKDAFATATATLAARIQRFGADSPIIKQWVEAQDEVFANCQEGQHIPTLLETMDPLARADRTYQIAAANFYAGKHDEAQKMFAAIAVDSSSPWHQNAQYLVARTLIRKASLGAPETKNEALAQAETRLNEILSDKTLGSLHPAAARLLTIVKLRLHPESRLHELAVSLMKSGANSELKQELWDYTVLLDQMLGDDDSETKKDIPASLRDDDLTDWIISFQSAKSEDTQHAVSKWQSTRSLPWLVAAISKLAGRDPSAAALTAEAARISANSPAYQTVFFHIVRLALENGKVDEARAQLDASLKQNAAKFTKSSLNQLLNLRALLARNLVEFLTYSQRVPAGFSWNDDGREIPSDLKEEGESNRVLEGQPLFDKDAAKVINQELPLNLLKQAAETKSLATALRRDIAQAAWLRAVLLGDNKTAEALVPTVKELVPGLSPLLAAFVSAPADEKRYAAIYAWLKFPGLEPMVDTGIGRQTALSEQDTYRDNWWCGSAFPPGTSTGNEEGNEENPEPEYTPVFLTAVNKQQAAREYGSLLALGVAPNYLCRQAVQWATKAPGDPRVPEALHLAVKSTRYGCTDKDTGRWSKAAFDTLHKLYPKSVWAKQTPYWFKE